MGPWVNELDNNEPQISVLLCCHRMMSISSYLKTMWWSYMRLPSCNKTHFPQDMFPSPCIAYGSNQSWVSGHLQRGNQSNPPGINNLHWKSNGRTGYVGTRNQKVHMGLGLETAILGREMESEIRQAQNLMSQNLIFRNNCPKLVLIIFCVCSQKSGLHRAQK